MQQRWSAFSVGILSGIVAVLLTVVVLQNREPAAYAATQASEDGLTGGIVVSSGGSAPDQHDLLWVLFKRKAESKTGEDTESSLRKDEQITLCCYQASGGARGMRLVGVRNISYDMDFQELHNEPPTVREVFGLLKKQEADRKEAEKRKK